MGKRISRIDLADCRNVDQLVTEILRLLPDLTPPIPIEEIANELDISGIEELKVEGFVGALVTDSDKSSGTILVKNDLDERRRRFTVGHELGHFLCPTHIPLKATSFYCTAGDMALSSAPKSNIGKFMEVQANRFSAHLLMPKRMFHSRIPSRIGPNLKHVLELSDIFNTSKETTARRYVDIREDKPCAVVMSRDGKVRYPYRHEDFPYLPISKDGPMPQGISTKSNLPPGHLSEPTDADPSVWFEDQHASRVDYLSEQVLVQSDGFRITMLVADLTDEDN